MQKLLLERSLDHFSSFRGLEGEQDDKSSQTTDWKIDIETPKFVKSVQVQSWQDSTTGNSPMFNNKDKAVRISSLTTSRTPLL